MRLSQRAALFLLVGYGLLVGVFAFAVDRGLRELERSLTAEAIGLLAREQSALVAERAIEALQFPDAASRRRVGERVASLAQLSTVVTGCSVVDREGHVVAGDPIAQPMPPADSVFGRDLRVVVEPGRGLLGGGEYVAFVPLSESGRLLGYLRMLLRSRDVASLYAQTRWRILGGAVAGVGLVALLAALLQGELRRRAQAVSDALEGRTGRGLSPGDEFSRVVDAASRVRRALNQAHDEGTQLRDRFGALAEALEVGVLVSRGPQLAFASPRGLELLGAGHLEAAAKIWAGLPAAQRSDPWRGPLDLPGERRLHAEVSHLESGESVVLLHDARPLDALETDLRLAAQVEALARVYRAFAHELRAPLGALTLHLDLLVDPASASPVEHARHVDVLRGEVERLARLLEDVLTHEAPDPDRQVPLDLGRLLADLAGLLAPQARKQNVELDVDLPQAPIPLVGYPDRLTQAFLNLAVNALEAMPHGGRLELQAQVPGPDAVQVRFSDTGEGMSTEQLAQALAGGASTKASGHGIGLGVARALLALHAGRLEVRSTPGQGTTVEVELPLAPRAWTGAAH
jgi:signal transduction histidine kinase